MLKLVGVIRQQGAYRVTLKDGGPDLQWTTALAGGGEVIVEEPETDIWSRIMLELLALLVPESLL